MVLALAADPLPLRLDSGGTYRVGQTRVRLDTVVFAYNQGYTAEQIARDYPPLEPADVHLVIAYYLNHKSDVDAYLAVRQEEAAKLRAKVEALPQNKALRENLIARRNDRA